MIKENLRATGQVSFILTDENGNIKQQDSKNLVVSPGLAFIVSRMINASAAAMSHMAVGTGTAATDTTQTALVTEAARVALTSSTIVTTTVANDSAQYVATFGPGVGTAAITEAGIFNAASAGTMLARTVFPVINKGALDTLSLTWKITVA